MVRPKSAKKRVVVLGAGFGGLEFCKRFREDDVEVILIDRQNHHLFQPLLYQVATAGLAVPEIAEPTRKIFRSRKNLTVLLDEVQNIDLEAQTVALEHKTLSYDYLVIGLGARTNYFGNDHWERHAPGLKSIDDAMRIRHDLLLAFEQAESTDDPVLRQELLTIAVIGGGPTGVEMAGAISELARHVLRQEFRHVDLNETRVVLVEAMPRILGAFPEALAAKGQKQLEELNVEVITGTKVRDIRERVVELEDDRTIRAANILWTAGVSAVDLVRNLGVETDRAGRLKVNPDLSLPGHPEAFAIGDVVHLIDANGNPVPGVSPAAMQMGRHAADLITAECAGRDIPPAERKAFAYFDKGYMATIGRSRAVAKVGPLEFTRFPAWLAWLFIHLIFLVGFRNKLAVLVQWFYAYVNYQHGARVITGLGRLLRAKSSSSTGESPSTDPEREKQTEVVS